MSPTEYPFSISNKLVIMPLREQKAYLISCADWDYLRKKVERIRSSALFLHTIGSTFIGVAIASFFPAFLTQYNWIWIIVVGATIGGILLLTFSYRERRIIACTKDDVIEEMQRIENKHKAEMESISEKTLKEIITYKAG